MTFFFARRAFQFVRERGLARRGGPGWVGALAVSVMLAGCSLYEHATQRVAQAITPYRIDIVQGNFVSREQAAQLKPGMTREQARHVLGTPLLTDLFHANRWDYVFSFKRGDASVVRERSLTLWFEGDGLVKWAGAEDLPSEAELIAEIDGFRQPEKNAAQATGESAAAAPP